MAEHSPETPQVKRESWQQMHDGLFWPRYAPLLPGHPADGLGPHDPYEMIARVVEYLSPYLRDRHP